ncbi:MAG TPA: hypothetical protein VKV32_11470 [Stellaceae bacterium]|nr:hypothetical protein [Stellaceae bacterium]
MQRIRYAFELVGIAHGINGDDPAVRDFERGGLKNAALLDGDEARQAVDQTVAHQA